MPPPKSSKKSATSKTVSKSASGPVHPSLSQKFRMTGSKLIACMKPSDTPSVMSHQSSKPASGENGTTHHNGQMNSKKKSPASASQENIGSVARSSPLEKPRIASENSVTASHRASSKKKSVIPSKPLSASKRLTSASNRSNCTGSAAQSQGESMAKSEISSKTLHHSVTKATPSSKTITAHKKNRSVHVHYHHHHHAAGTQQPQIVVVQRLAHRRHSPTVACNVCKCDIDDVTYSQSECCFDCGTSRGNCN